MHFNVEASLGDLKSAAHMGEQEYKAMRILLGVKAWAQKARKKACGELMHRI